MKCPFFNCLIFVSCLFLPLGNTSWAATAGTTGGNILAIPVGARAIAMGEAFTAQADDVSSLYWNPAGLGLLNQSQASFMYNNSYADIKHQNAAVALAIENGGIGASISYLSFGPIAGYDIHNVPTGDVKAHSSVGTLGGGLIGGPWSLGFNAKAVQATLVDVNALGMAADVGAIYTHQTPILEGTLRLGTSVRNLGTGLKFIDQKDAFPLEWRVGAAAVQMAHKKLNTSLDFGKQIGAPWSVFSGMEYWLISNLALRAGYIGSGQEGNGLRLGIGLKIKDIAFDYAYSHYGDLGLAHRYEMIYRFGPVTPLLSPEERQLFRKAKLAMADGRYGEATLLFDSLLTMEPRYKPFRRFLKTALHRFEGQERELAKMDKPFHLNLYGLSSEADPEIEEIANLFTEDTTEGLAKKTPGAAEAPLSPEQNALAPLIPGQKPNSMLEVQP